MCKSACNDNKISEKQYTACVKWGYNHLWKKCHKRKQHVLCKYKDIPNGQNIYNPPYTFTLKEAT